ncbi:MAG TPA: hypothetical protein VFB80_20355 [Pirellulaceae bacterium]|nr:hypothetical protein [Pirellulaceae bacterium]
MSRFEYPNVCCRCAVNEPTQTWGVQSHESKPGDGNSVVTITYTCPVPVCARCHRGLSMLLACCWFVALSIGAVAGWFIYDWAIHRPHADTFPEFLQIGMPVLLGGMIAWGCAWLLKAFFINYDFVHYDPDNQTMVFKNKQYQYVFDQLNHTSPGRTWG